MEECVKKMGLSLCFIFTVLCSTIHAGQVWSPWYNSSPGPAGPVENETLDRIAMTYTLPCSRSQVVAVQCRVAGNSSSNATFSGQFRHAGNVLHVPCNLTGLLCRLHDQILAGTANRCRDYEVRVLCLLDDEGLNPEDKNNDDDDLGANGGFTAMVAGGSVVIPLICILIFQLRRYKREERQRQQQSRQAADDLSRGEATSSSSDAPPTYEELFGRPAEPVSTISDGALGAGSSEVQSGTERLLNSYTERLEGRVNPGASLDLSVSSLAASTSVPESNSVPSSSTTTVQAAVSSSQVVQSHSSVSSSDTVSTSMPSDDTRNQRVSLTSSASSSTTTSTDILMPPSSSGSDITHPGPPPAYDWPASAHVTIVVPESGGRTSSCPHSSTSSGVVQSTSSGGRRFLGMHLSIFDLMAAIYPDPASTPPPSYDDALKILEASKASQVQIT